MEATHDMTTADMTTADMTTADMTTETGSALGSARRSAEHLRIEFEGMFNAETIERYIIESEQQLMAQATVTKWLPVTIERLTRDRLRAVARIEGLSDGKPSVLFLCVHNAGRSQIAAGWLQHLAGDRVEVFSGGSEPADDTNQAVVEAMAKVGIDISSHHPKPWSDEVARAADVIITMGCGDACPVLPGTRYEDWELPSITGGSSTEILALRDDIRLRVEALIASLGVESS